MVSVGMSDDADILSDDPAVLKAMIAALQAENARMSATLQAHEQLVQALRLRIAKQQLDKKRFKSAGCMLADGRQRQCDCVEMS